MTRAVTAMNCMKVFQSSLFAMFLVVFQDVFVADEKVLSDEPAKAELVIPKAQPLWPDATIIPESAREKPELAEYFLYQQVDGAGDAKSEKRPCLVILPGGGYGMLAINHEGHDIANWANQNGMVALICKYRNQGTGHGHPVPSLDAKQAIRTVRANADAWNVDPQRVGLIGFSAGGHLASTVLTHFDDGDSSSSDRYQQQSCRPDFGILAYPVIAMGESIGHAGSLKNLLGENPAEDLVESLCNYKQVTAKTPPTFLFHTLEDKVVLPQNSLRFYSAMVEHNVQGELHIFERGVHGVGLAKSIEQTSAWPTLCLNWLQTRKVLVK